MGADSWEEITTWREWEKVLLMANHIVMTRPGTTSDSGMLPKKCRDAHPRSAGVHQVVIARLNRHAHLTHGRSQFRDFGKRHPAKIYATDDRLAAADVPPEVANVRRKISDLSIMEETQERSLERESVKIEIVNAHAFAELGPGSPARDHMCRRQKGVRHRRARSAQARQLYRIFHYRKRLEPAAGSGGR